MGGTDITNAKIGTFNLATVGGAQAITGAGFQQDFLMFLSPTRAAAADTNVTAGAPNLGFARAASEEGSIGFGVRDGQAGGNAGHVISSTSALSLMRRDTSDGVADLRSMDTDGFTLNVTTVSGGTQPVYYLALKGGQNKIGFMTQPASGTPPISQSTTGVGFQPVGIMFASANDATYNTVNSGGTNAAAKFSVGASNISTEGAI